MSQSAYYLVKLAETREVWRVVRADNESGAASVAKENGATVKEFTVSTAISATLIPGTEGTR